MTTYKHPRVLTLLIAAAPAVWLTSCIREDLPDCPPLHVDVAVKDKNYFNAAATGGLEPVRPENLSFGSYVGTLYYRLDDAATGRNVVERTRFSTAGADGATYGIDFPADLPFGRYVLTVWGNMQSDRPLADNAAYTEVTAAHAADNDIYVTVDTLDYTYDTASYTAHLERTKGKLIVVAEGLPEGVDYSTKDLDNIYRYVGRSLRYAGTTDFHTELAWSEPHNAQSAMLLCPSTGHEQTTLDVKFFQTGQTDAPARQTGTLPEPAAEPAAVRLTLSRNEVTVVRYVYQPAETRFDIFVLINDNWEQIHHMEVE